MTPAEMRARLERLLPAARLKALLDVSRIAEEHGSPVYLVGGLVRQLLLGQPISAGADLDFVVEGDAPALARAVARAWGGEVVVHAPFGTATWRSPADDSSLAGEAIDFASTRSETYPEPAALPRVTPALITADLARRDFTINAIALRVDGSHCGEVLDPHGGEADLEARLVRVLHPRSFVDDPTRLFRAVRYEQRLGFSLAPETLALMSGAGEALQALTGDRIRHELELIFREEAGAAMLTRLQALGLLAGIHPALRWDETKAARAGGLQSLPVEAWRLEAPPEPDAPYLALLLEDSSSAERQDGLKRLNAGKAVAQAVEEACEVRGGWARPSEAVAALDALSELGVLTAYVVHAEQRPALHDYLARWRFVKAQTTGDDLIMLGMTPGPLFRQILWELRAARLDGEATTDLEERALLRRLQAEAQ